jgi:AmmeMemoRadiSam system protein B
MKRMPAVSGQFYPGTASGLSGALLSLTREVESPEPAIGVVVPHAGYVYSGAVAGEVFSSVHVPARAVIFCPNHTGLGENVSVMSHGAWRMPWGDVPIDEDLAARLENACPLLREDASAHSREHAIEVQLPFLHRFRPDVRIVPVALGRLSLEECRELGENVADAIAEDAERPLLVASSDMSHYVPDAVARRKDGMAIDRMLAPRGSTGPSGPSGSRCAGYCRPRSSSSPPAALARHRPA